MQLGGEKDALEKDAVEHDTPPHHPPILYHEVPY